MKKHAWFVVLACVMLSGLSALLAGESALADVRLARMTASASASCSFVNAAPLPPGAKRGDHGPSDIIFPHQRVPLNFDHAKHHQRGVKCITCHSNARSSRRAEESIVFSSAACDKCHGTRHGDFMNVLAGPKKMGQCAVCHEGYSPDKPVDRILIPLPRLKFNHQVHAARNIKCGQCHGAVHRIKKASRTMLPRMRACLVCHNLPDDSRGDAKAGCPTCHLTRASGVMKTKFNNGALLPPRWLGAQHGPDFANTHGPSAANNSSLCAQCHTEDQCARCHDGRVRPRNVHPNDFLSMHALAAKQNAQRCSSCHRQESFCKTCHMRAGVSASGPAWKRRNQGRVHPPPDVFVSGPVTGRHHATEARRNLMSCVGCHVERDCVGCHATKSGGGIGVNPHPAGFSSRCRSAMSRNVRPCLVCHEPSDPELSRCR